MFSLLTLKVLELFFAFGLSSAPNNIRVVSTTNTYGVIAKLVLGNRGEVYSLVKDNEDPHDFTPTIKDAQKVSQANIIIENGIGYDSWMNDLVNNTGTQAKVIIVADLVHKHAGDNEHIWYDLVTVKKLVKELTLYYIKFSPENKDFFIKREKRVINNWDKLNSLIIQLAHNSRNEKVDVSEPVFDYSLLAMHYRINDVNFARSIQDGIDPSPSDFSHVQSDIRNHKIKFFVNNAQTDNDIVNNLVSLCHKNNIPVVTVTETTPNKTNYFVWLNSPYQQIKHIQKSAKN